MAVNQTYRTYAQVEGQIDARGYIKGSETYTKEEIDAINSSGYRGEAFPTTVPTAEQLTSSGKWDTKTAGTYTAMGGLVISAADLADGRQIQILYTEETGLYSKLFVGQNLSGYATDAELAALDTRVDSLEPSVALLMENSTVALTSTVSANGLFLQPDGFGGSLASTKVISFPVVAGQEYRIKGGVTSPALPYGTTFSAWCFYSGAAGTQGPIAGSMRIKPGDSVQDLAPTLYDEMVVAPAGAIRLQFTQVISPADSMTVGKLASPTDNAAAIVTLTTGLQKTTELAESNFETTSKSVASFIQVGAQYIQRDGFFTFDAAYNVVMFPVTPGKTILIEASVTSPAQAGTQPIGAFGFYAAKNGGSYITGTIVTQPATTAQSTIPVVYQRVVTVPANAQNIGFTQKVSSDSASVRVVIKSADLEADLSEIKSNKVTCWGDSITWGAAPEDGRYWTLILQELLGANYQVVNCGVGGETAVNIPMRQGAMPMYNSLDYTLPAATTLVPVGRFDAWFYSGFFKSTFDDVGCPFLLQGQGRDYATINPCFVDGIECTLSYVSESASPTTGQYYIKRNVAGTLRVIKAGSIIYTNAAKNLVPGATVLFMGTNDGWTTTADLIARYKKMIAFSNVGKLFVVIGIYGGSAEDNHNLDKAAYELMEKAFAKEFGLNYINLRKYAVEHGLSDAGITPTQADLDAIALGKCPPSLIPDGVHPNSAFSNEIAKLVHTALVQLGV